METQIIYIQGIDPYNEVLAEVFAGRYLVGTPIIALGSGDYPHHWYYVVSSDGLRIPTDLESYLFKHSYSINR